MTVTGAILASTTKLAGIVDGHAHYMERCESWVMVISLVKAIDRFGHGDLHGAWLRYGLQTALHAPETIN